MELGKQTPFNKGTEPVSLDFCGLSGEVQARMPGQKESPKIDLAAVREKAMANLLREQERDASMAFFDALVSRYPEMHPDRTRWDDKKLMQNSSAIAAVRGWDFDESSRLASVDRLVAKSRFTNNDPAGLFLYGPTGRGKTRALFALMQNLAYRGRRFGFMFAGDWFAELGKKVRYGRDEAGKWVDEVASCPIFILDDVGQEAVLARSDEWAQSHFFRFLDLRISRGLPLVVSTNLNSVDMVSPGTEKGSIRRDPMIRRFCDLCRFVEFK